ncbi:DUF2889 domain-containing protein [Spongiibacter sp. KMU-166]|uniref:DUF2889 domain-containing protein n=1 Tax=Spongiibacter thalassae TaxID=2721624 RepID=A0ABX1GCA8_9GAMM|nr:DUF2889 domain-containing protein [Spongiibacter thalassae]NKI16586.1 DUF2889 domain-containing protein [Spongiibacter thalassae]
MVDNIDVQFIDSSKTETGTARRMIDLRRWDAHTVVGWLEDDFHHFGVTLTHSGDRITGVSATAQRYPWTTCAFAPESLTPLTGQTMLPRCSDIGGMIPMRQQCTHIFDLAGLVMAHAVRGNDHRRYQTITESREILGWKDHKSPLFGPTTITLLQDNAEVMAWHCESGAITDRESGHQQALGRGFRQWTESLPMDKAEHATVLRRALLVSGGRSMVHDRYPNAAAMDQPELCYSFQQERRDQALRMSGATRDYANEPERMLSCVNTRP